MGHCRVTDREMGLLWPCRSPAALCQGKSCFLFSYRVFHVRKMATALGQQDWWVAAKFNPSLSHL